VSDEPGDRLACQQCGSSTGKRIILHYRVAFMQVCSFICAEKMIDALGVDVKAIRVFDEDVKPPSIASQKVGRLPEEKWRIYFDTYIVKDDDPQGNQLRDAVFRALNARRARIEAEDRMRRGNRMLDI
jgi:hypothetical protein